MAGAPCGNQEYDAAAAAANYNVAIDPRYSELHFNSAASTGLQNAISGLNISPYHDYAEFSDFIPELLGPDDLLGDLQPLSPSPTTLDEILSLYGSDRPRPSSYTSMPTHNLLQESTICHLQPQVYERSPSLTVFVAPPPPPSKVVQLQFLRAPAHDNKATVPSQYPIWSTHTSTPHHLDAKFASDFAFHRHQTSDYPLFDGFDTAVSKGSPSSMPPASTTNLHNNQNDYAPKIMAEGPKLILTPEKHLGRSPSVQTWNSNAGAFSGFAAMEFSSASAAKLSTSPSFSRTSMLNFEGMCHSASVSPPPSLNSLGAALHESFQSVEDFGSGNQLVGRISQTVDVDKLPQYKGAWRTAQGGIHKRRNYSGRTSLPDSVCDNVAATLRITDLEESNSTHLPADSRVQIRVKTQDLSLHDGYVWRKYGKKTIKNDTHSRNYMRCEESKRRGCRVLKRTQRCSLDEKYVVFHYLGKHNHPP